MPFDTHTCSLLETFTNNPPLTEDDWYGVWVAILTALFPPVQGYMVSPKRHLPSDVLEVVKLTSTNPLTLRTVLIVKILNSQHWNTEYGSWPGIETLERKLNLHANSAFNETARTKVYWIGVIGSHWRYGEKDDGIDDGQDLQPLIDWHDTTHDQASYDDLQILAGLVGALAFQGGLTLCQLRHTVCTV